MASGTTSSTYMAPSGGYSSGKAIGIGAGVAAAAVGIGLYIHHRHSTSRSQGSIENGTLRARNRVSWTHERDHQNYLPFAMYSDPPVGARTEPPRQKAEDHTGDLALRRRDLVKAYGTFSIAATLDALTASR